MSTPPQRRHVSSQRVMTPPDFLEAVTRRFGPIAFDLAADTQTSITPCWFGPGSPYGEDALTENWGIVDQLPAPPRTLPWRWLNPEYARLGPWVEKCALEAANGVPILLLTPASVGATWYRQWVRPFAYSLFVSPRLQFVGHHQGYPKDLMLSVYAHGLVGTDTWVWKARTSTRETGDGE